MGDLAESLVELGRAAKTRSHARRELKEATEVVAAAIRKQLRSRDVVEVVDPDRVDEMVGYCVVRVWDGEGNLQQVLARELAILEPIEESVSTSAEMMREGVTPFGTPDDPDGETVFHVASARERSHFAQEAALVVKLFEKQLRQDAEDYTGAAQQLVKLAVR